MTNKYHFKVVTTPAKPRSKKLQGLPYTGKGGSTIVIGSPSQGGGVDGHTHANKLALDAMTIDYENYLHLTQQIAGQTQTRKVKAGDSDLWQGKQFGDYIDQPVRKTDDVEFNMITAIQALIKDFRTPGYVAGLLGTGAHIDEFGNAVFQKLYANLGFSAPSMEVNGISMSNGEHWFTDCGRIKMAVKKPVFRWNNKAGTRLKNKRGNALTVTNNGFYCEFVDSRDDHIMCFKKGDILQGIYRKNKTDVEFKTVFYYIKLVLSKGYIITMLGDTTIEPDKDLELARVGNDTDVTRQGSMYIGKDPSSGKYFLRVQEKVNSQKVTRENIAVQLGYIGDVTDGTQEYGIYAFSMVVQVGNVNGLSALLEVLNVKISLKVSNDDLLKTGIDIENKKVTVTADKFLVKGNKDKPIALFKIGANGQPLVKAENIDVENLEARVIDTVTADMGGIRIRPAEIFLDDMLEGFSVEGDKTIAMSAGNSTGYNMRPHFTFGTARSTARYDSSGINLTNKNDANSLFKVDIDKKTVKSKGLSWDTPGYLCKARIIDGKSIQKKGGAFSITEARNEVNGAANKRVYHNVGHTGYSASLTYFGRCTMAKVIAETANYVDVDSNGDFNIFLFGSN